MGMYGGSEGYSTSNTASQPWDVQANYLQPLFKSTYAAGYGQDATENLSQSAKNKLYAKFEGIEQDTGEWVPGKLEYFGDRPRGIGGGPWGTGNETIINQYASDAPTVADFSDEERIAQDIINARLQGKTSVGGYNTGATSLIPSSKTALENIIKGSTRINPASMSAASVSPQSAIELPMNITKPVIGTPGTIPQVTIANQDMPFRYWNELGDVASGQRNPYLEDMISNARRNMTNEFYNYQLPSLDTTAEAAGRYGGNTWAKLRGDAYDKYLQNVGQIESTMRGEAYNTDANRALQAMNLGGELATTEANLGASKNQRQAGMDLERFLQQYQTEAAAKQLTGQLGLEAEKTSIGNQLTRNIQQSENELQRNIQNALLGQEAGKTTAGFQQEANVGNVTNILQGTPLAAPVSQADFEDIAKLAAVGESKTAKAQDIIDAFIQRFQTNQMEPYERAAIMSNLLSGDFGGTTMSTGSQQSGGGYL